MRLFGRKNAKILAVYSVLDNSKHEMYCREGWAHFYADGQRQYWQPEGGLRVEESKRDAPLSSRDWAFQERLLASRYVHFTSDELFWECRISVTCECKFLDNLESVANRSDNSIEAVGTMSQQDAMGFHTSNPNFNRILLSPNRTNIFCQWLQMVELYSRQEFRDRRDFLPALSVLAKQMQRLSAGVYLAGLWKDDILNSLLWGIGRNFRINRGTLGEGIQLAQGLPSWSWILAATVQSSRGEHHYGVSWPLLEVSQQENKNYRTWPSIVYWACTPAGLDPTGAVRHGKITPRGKICQYDSNWPITTCLTSIDSTVGINSMYQEEKLHYLPLLETYDSKDAEDDPWYKCPKKYRLMLRKFGTDPNTYRRAGALISDIEIGWKYKYAGIKKYKEIMMAEVTKVNNFIDAITDALVTIL